MAKGQNTGRACEATRPDPGGDPGSRLGRYPIELLAGVADHAELRRRLGRGQARVGRAPGAKGGGNTTKTICLWLRLAGEDEVTLVDRIKA